MNKIKSRHIWILVVLLGMLFDGGYAKAERINSTAYGYTLYYYNKDHLGNIREVMNASGNLQQKTNYYPFGGIIADICAEQNIQPYKYNGKELVTMHGLNTYDYGARQYYPILCRWDRVDPLCEKYYSVSPYAYCNNNPVKYIDSDGRKIYIPKHFQPVVLQMINTYSKTQYKVDEKGYMCIDKDAGINEKGSAHYSERLDATISVEDKQLTILIGEKYTITKGNTSKTFDVKKYGGGLTDNKSNKSNVKIVVSKEGNLAHDTKGNEVKKPAGEVLIHEIVGHAAPSIAGTETGNAVENENIVRRELKLPERIEEEKHHE